MVKNTRCRWPRSETSSGDGHLGACRPGARDAGSRIVSAALTSGLAVTFEENEDLVDGWEYSAVLDGATCERCRPLDGTTYASWAAIQAVLPGGGPNPSCPGGGRCRCRAIPAAQT